MMSVQSAQRGWSKRVAVLGGLAATMGILAGVAAQLPPANAQTAPVADLAVSQTVSGTAMVGQALTFTVTVTNNGPNDAPNVTIWDTIPAGAKLLPLANPD